MNPDLDLHDPHKNWAPLDPETGTHAGWYLYPSSAEEVLHEAESADQTLFPTPRVPWQADTEFLNDFFHTLEMMHAADNPARKRVQYLIYKRMLDCMYRDYMPWSGSIEWPDLREYRMCGCAVALFAGHLEVEHEQSYCTGSWGWDPPCGGCVNCMEGQAIYSAYKEKNFGLLTWAWMKLEVKIDRWKRTRRGYRSYDPFTSQRYSLLGQ